MSAFDMDSGFDAVSGGVAAPKSSVVPEHGQGGDFDPFAAAAASAQPTVATAAPLSGAGAAAPVVAAAAGAAVATNTGTAVVAVDEKAAPAGPTPYQLWEEKHQALLAEKRQKEAEAKKAVVAAAKADIVKFMAARDERIAQRKIDNRAEEKASLAATKTVMSAGSSAMFEKIGRMVDLSAKANDKRPGVDRFRKLLINLKTQPPVHIAAGAAGAGAGAGADMKLA